MILHRLNPDFYSEFQSGYVAPRFVKPIMLFASVLHFPRLLSRSHLHSYQSSLIPSDQFNP